jgi:hypothetical protein
VPGQIQARYPDAKIPFISGYIDDAVLRSGLIDEQVGFLDGPFTTKGLAAKDLPCSTLESDSCAAYSTGGGQTKFTCRGRKGPSERP